MLQHRGNSIRRLHRWLEGMAPVLMVMCALLVACSQRAPVAAVAPHEIAWFKGTMEQAIGAAQQRNRPLLAFPRRSVY
jgi:hypothetical protein